ncbi:hypothetical protein SERLADRAFT_413459 [Serpula lacrymans var. lacrymans S7.9]|uniref:Cytochrome P450 n=1 Tax=Serpula lacrymans var. lacrymans (strain S7.9) TaxID=578457 RepID=F8NLS4_SERL9|nr:uncharacterized protein SERLADRAFT_413459 [Serpula lacrymans var. lacrymans S7.9]EGO28626.1 hypothetical protein SERLADRAFT_413459 [Serpula lacrymans var. lacrymans S7.9]
MANYLSLPYTVTGSLVVFSAYYIWRSYSSRRYKLPPGPRPDPIIGNLRQFPKGNQPEVFSEWGKEFGDVVYVQIFGRGVLVLNSIRAVNDLLEKRGSIYSDRPRQVAFGELFAAGTIMQITYGHAVESIDDQYIKLADDVLDAALNYGSAGSEIVDLIPVFTSVKYLPEWMPGAGFKRRAAVVRKLVRAMMQTPFEMVKKKKVAVTLHTFILAMAMHPDIYKKAQDEIDQVTGASRLPNIEDRPELPYLNCIMKEVHRWNPPVQLALPHKLMTKDDEYRGYFIPQGTTVIANVRGMLQDPEIYPEPEKFRPERFMEMTAEDAERYDPRGPVFGFGRRVCPGKLFAGMQFFLAASRITATFDILALPDEHGKGPSAAFNGTIVSHPRPFKCDIKPRSENCRQLILEEDSQAGISNPSQVYEFNRHIWFLWKNTRNQTRIELF